MFRNVIIAFLNIFELNAKPNTLTNTYFLSESSFNYSISFCSYLGGVEKRDQITYQGRKLIRCLS